MPCQSPVVYFHGMPGSPRELDLFSGQRTTRMLYSPDRTSSRSAPDIRYLDVVAADIRTRFPAGNLEFLAFSLGAYSALQVAARLGSLVIRIDMVSSAAPLETGDYPNMAGGSVFRLANGWPRSFSFLAHLQALTARRASGLLYHALFATARGADRELARQDHFKATMMNVLHDCFSNDASGYREELRSYASQWADVLPKIEQPVTLWHGEADNWAPVEMASALQMALPNVVRIHRLAGLSHFTTLEVALRERDVIALSKGIGVTANQL